jgi:hypothetical protein
VTASYSSELEGVVEIRIYLAATLARQRGCQAES